MAIAAKDVQELRKSTGAGMMDAKKALTEADGDFEAAVQILREKGLAKAAGRSDRENSEGIVVVAENDEAAALVHLKSETDFAAKSDDFVKLAHELAELVLAKGPEAVAEKAEAIEELKLTVKENIDFGQVARFEKTSDALIDAYVHGGGRAGVLVEATGVDAETLHEIALHIAFAKPTYLSRDEIPADEVERERSALLEITKNEGKPEAAWDKIVEGRLNAWFAERVLPEQGVFGEKETVEARVGDGIINRFVLAMVG
ncbi:MAG: translation elongation factor Ts [Acidimicrobiia bacterium]|nr:translation elongation factor Ts [Acidimicrobiia bacterium]MDH5521384.1 translation elongation factor Ts [Acidimicrobiia bacterium]